MLREQVRRLGRPASGQTAAEDIARVIHAANRELQIVQGDPRPSPPWDEAPEYQVRENVASVVAALTDPERTPEQSHRDGMTGCSQTAGSTAPSRTKQQRLTLTSCRSINCPSTRSRKTGCSWRSFGRLLQKPQRPQRPICDNFLYQKLQGHAFGAPDIAVPHSFERRHRSATWRLCRRGCPALGGGSAGESSPRAAAARCHSSGAQGADRCRRTAFSQPPPGGDRRNIPW